ncbi:MAG: hypothetical protein ABSH08_05205 [Tepidisphaeraceae bacterium]|jgi:hypothetical protein
MPNRLKARGCTAITNHVPKERTCILQRQRGLKIVQNSISGSFSVEVGPNEIKLKNYADRYSVEIDSRKYER